MPFYGIDAVFHERRKTAYRLASGALFSLKPSRPIPWDARGSILLLKMCYSQLFSAGPTQCEQNYSASRNSASRALPSCRRCCRRHPRALLGIPRANKLLRPLADKVGQRLPRVVVRWVAGPVHQVVNLRASINCELLLASQLLRLPYALLLARRAERVVLRDLLHLRLGRQALHVEAHLCKRRGRWPQ